MIRLLAAVSLLALAGQEARAQSGRSPARSSDASNGQRDRASCSGNIAARSPGTAVERYRVRTRHHRRALLDSITRQQQRWTAARPPAYSYTIRRTGGWLNELAWGAFCVRMTPDGASLRDSTGLAMAYHPT
jgi:hypothetical protein